MVYLASLEADPTNEERGSRAVGAGWARAATRGVFYHRPAVSAVQQVAFPRHVVSPCHHARAMIRHRPSRAPTSPGRSTYLPGVAEQWVPVRPGFTRPFINHIVGRDRDGSCDYKVTLRHACHAVGRSGRARDRTDHSVDTSI